MTNDRERVIPGSGRTRPAINGIAEIETGKEPAPSRPLRRNACSAQCLAQAAQCAQKIAQCVAVIKPRFAQVSPLLSRFHIPLPIRFTPRIDGLRYAVQPRHPPRLSSATFRLMFRPASCWSAHAKAKRQREAVARRL